MNDVMVSVIIPAYNPKYIFEAVASAFLQDVSKEIIIIDDCSTTEWTESFVNHLEDCYDISDHYYHKKNADGSMLLKWVGNVTLNSLENSKFSIYIFKNTENKNVGTTRNRGVRLAKGNYVAFLDADDMWLNGKLEKQLELMEHDVRVPLCSTARRMMDSDGTLLDKVITVPARITLKDLERTNCINLSSVLVRKDVMQKYPMRHSDAHEDYLSWLMLFKEYEYALGLNEPLLLYRKTKEGKSGNKLKSAIMTYRTYRYAGFGVIKAGRCFLSYAVNGVKKRL
ncbi:MAG: glycosyltransferase family 2 protein [Lachnospiraceae bacterium]|nr:glycosyltransferase family 2 protein [Lachnospiraceae bacterium]